MAAKKITVTCPHCGSADIPSRDAKTESRLTYVKIQVARRSTSQSRTPTRAVTRT